MKFPRILRRAPPPLPTEAELTRQYGPVRDVSLRTLAAPKAPTASVISPGIGDFTPILWAGRRLTPDQVRFILEGAIGGNFQQQWSLCDLMEDTWPRLAKNLGEVRRAAARASLSVQPYAERGEKPTETAIERAATVEAAIKNWRPQPGTLELGFEDALYNALDALGKGLSVQEITWQITDDGILPRCAHLLPPGKYGWNAAGNELGLVANAGPSALSSQLATTWQPFPPGQFWVGVWHGRSGAPAQTALLRCLAPYWIGVTFGWEWLLNNAQIFGVPFRWATYDPNRPENLATLSTMLANLGSAGWAAFPQGTTLDFKEATKSATDNPQVFIQELADKYCDQLILGQDASGAAQGDGFGAGSGKLHASVRDSRLQDAAQWCADLLNYQLVPAVLRLNYGDEEEQPAITIDDAGETDPKAKADRDQVLSSIAPLPAKWFYERHSIPPPEDGEQTVGGPGLNPLNLPGSPGSLGTAPGQPSDAGAPATDPENPDPAKSTTKADPAAARGKTAGGAVQARSVNPPRSAVVLRATAAPAASVRQPISLPGGYQPPPATLSDLAAAHARDLAPFRKAAEPLLSAIEAGNLAVVGELEAFIAHLDKLGPTILGASALADALESALTEASISGAAGAYSKLETAKS